MVPFFVFLAAESPASPLGVERYLESHGVFHYKDDSGTYGKVLFESTSVKLKLVNGKTLIVTREINGSYGLKGGDLLVLRDRRSGQELKWRFLKIEGDHATIEGGIHLLPVKSDEWNAYDTPGSFKDVHKGEQYRASHVRPPSVGELIVLGAAAAFKQYLEQPRRQSTGAQSSRDGDWRQRRACEANCEAQRGTCHTGCQRLSDRAYFSSERSRCTGECWSSYYRCKRTCP